MDGKLLEALMEDRPEGMPERIPDRPVLYVKTRTIRSGSLTEVECYPVYSWAYRRALAKTRATAQAMRAVNDRNARKKFERLAECNFVPGRDYFLTLTYGGQAPSSVSTGADTFPHERGKAFGAPEDMETCNKELRNYLKRVNRARAKAGLGKARCVGVIETGKRGRLHHHLLIEGGLDRDTMERLWGHGYANCDRIQGGGMTALTKYMTKGFSTKRETGRHRYFYTRNLVQPRVTESRTRISRRQAERIREDADMYGEQIMRRKWPGLALEALTVKQTEWLPGAYIYARMRRSQ